MKFYAGIGSRNTPYDMQWFMTRVATKLEVLGWILRTGGAPGADQAFERGVKDSRNIEIYLPWRGFEGRRGIVSGENGEARSIAERFHPAWDRLGDGARKLMTRNTNQVLGGDLRTPAKFVLCWTPEGSGSGGTGQAIRIAKHYGIQVWDLGIPDVFGRVGWWLEKE
jgi:hypothetical protein